jgi:hypothetical protein
MKLNKALITTAMVFGIICSATVPALAAGTGSSAPPAASGTIPTDGTGTVIENSTDTPEKREFFTIKTPAGNVFYIVVDKQKTGENVYLLTPVTEADLAALAGFKTASTITGGSTVSRPEPDSTVSEAPSVSSRPAVSQAPGTSPESTTEKTAPVQQPPGNDTGTIVLVVLAVLIVGGAGFYFKIYRPRHEMGGTEDDAEELEEKSPDTDEGTPDEEEDGKDDDSNDENGEE